MPAADLRARRPGRRGDGAPGRPDGLRPARWVAGALAVQLLTASAALAGPWALTPAGARPVAPVAPAVVPAADDAPTDRTTPVLLSAPGLWDGAVEAVPLGTDARGQLDVPATASALGWWAAGPRPGEPGAAVVVGHVDLQGRPGVFARLASAGPGTTVVVGGAEPARFRVVRVDRYAKDAFPTEEVYRPTEGAELRLITCGGRFDPRTGHYEDNVVVRAVRV